MIKALRSCMDLIRQTNSKLTTLEFGRIANTGERRSEEGNHKGLTAGMNETIPDLGRLGQDSKRPSKFETNTQQCFYYTHVVLLAPLSSSEYRQESMWSSS